MNNTNTRRRIAVAVFAALVLGTTATACGKDVVDDDVEEKIDEADKDIKDFVDTVFTDETIVIDDHTTNTGG